MSIHPKLHIACWLISSDFSPGYYSRMWGLEWCLIENNIIELNIRSMGPIGFGEPIGIFMYGGGADPQYRMRQFVARGNLIRNIDNRSDPNKTTAGYEGFAEGLRIGDSPFVAQNALLQSNVFRLDRDEVGGSSMTHRVNVGTEVRTFENRSPDGKLILSLDRQTFVPAPELVAQMGAALEDVIIGALLK